MNIKIVIFVLFSISVQHSSAMMLPLNPVNQAKLNRQLELIGQRKPKKCICENLVIDLKPTDLECKKTTENYLDFFMQNSLEENSEKFHGKTVREQQAIFKRNGTIHKIVMLPNEMQMKILSYMFENQDQKAAELFITTPVEETLKDYADLPQWQQRINLPDGTIFRCNQDEKKVLTKVFENQIINTDEENTLKRLPGDIVYELSLQHKKIYVYEQGLKLAFKTLYQALSNLNSSDVLVMNALGLQGLFSMGEYFFNLDITHIARYKFSLPIMVSIYFFIIIKENVIPSYQTAKIKKIITVD